MQLGGIYRWKNETHE